MEKANISRNSFKEFCKPIYDMKSLETVIIGFKGCDRIYDSDLNEFKELKRKC